MVPRRSVPPKAKPPVPLSPSLPRDDFNDCVDRAVWVSVERDEGRVTPSGKLEIICNSSGLGQVGQVGAIGVMLDL
jgi:hypothetical protein